ncbi:hypothetical protein [Streptomyces mirabilis]|uniref:hypothetical protein n=1 Tax=Streptomyces mirabilis TaxID=68239 RepID=UPI0036D965EB
MPLALTPDHYDSWLDPHHQDPDELRALLTQPADGHLDARPSPPPSTTSAATARSTCGTSREFP